MLDKLRNIEEKYEDIEKKLFEPDVVSDIEQYRKLLKEQKRITPVVEKYREYKKAKEAFDESKALLDEGGLDKDFRELVEDEFATAGEDIKRINEELKLLLLPKDPNDEKSVIVEIRAGTGGEEAALFAGDLFRMYSMYAEAKGWSAEIVNSNDTELGGYKEITFTIEGEGAYSRFKFEAGVHRVQRVPETESQGRIQTSAVTVAVLPEAEEVDVEINPADLHIDYFRASGAGGQKVNKTSSAVRLIHIPTGTVVECQDERSQYKNKDRAMSILRSRILEEEQKKNSEAIAGERARQVGSGDRSERIRTYNFHEGRVTDHRIGLTLYKIDAILNGDLDEIVDALITADTAEKLKAEEE